MGLVLTVICLGGGIAGLITSPRQINASLVVASIASWGGFLIGFSIVLYKVIRRVRHVEVYPDRIKWTQGGVEHEYRWSDAREVYRYELILNNSRSATCQVIFADGSQLYFTPALEEDAKLAQLIQRFTHPSLLAQAKHDLEEGEARFGSLRLTSEGITRRKLWWEDFARPETSTLWDDVDRWQAGGGRLWLYEKSGKVQTLMLWSIPNYLVLLELLPPELQKQ
jgi:hypothetical protein